MNKQQEFDWTTFVQKAITFLVLLGIGRAGGFVAERLGYPPSLGRLAVLDNCDNHMRILLDDQ